MKSGPFFFLSLQSFSGVRLELDCLSAGDAAPPILLSTTVGAPIPLHTPGQSTFLELGCLRHPERRRRDVHPRRFGARVEPQGAVCYVGRDIDALEQALAEQPTEKKGERA